MILGNIFGPDLGIVAVIGVLVLVAGSKLPQIARNLGAAKGEFRKGQEEGDPSTPED